MTNPFGITEVDIPGALGAYEAGQTSRVNRLLRTQQLQAAERDADRRQRFDEILLGNATSPQGAKGGAAGAYSQPQPAQAPAAAMPSAPAAPAAAPPAQQTFDVSPDVLRQLAVLDPERAGQIVTALNSMDTAQRARLQAANIYMANAAQHLRGVPMAQRAAEIQRITPDLLAHGITQQQLQGFTPDDNSLDYVVQSAMDVERLAQVANPHYMSMEQGASIVNVNARNAQGQPAPRTVAESPVVTVQGMPYARPPEMSNMPQTRQARNRQTGQIETLQQNPQTGQWEPVTEAPAFRPPPGGAVSGQPGFP